ncbi:MAG TPA: 16S rRNA (guanine(966)-N(2))-methyltransferase RsmD [Phycisphaerae bacterium]|nr:16S rRNA (guanine(966)-N(2))-methyltransferase RsmD [Phycisphaerae bacterium]
MRIIGGRWRSRQIKWPQSGQTRPITDRVKSALFDILGSYYQTPGYLPEIQVADVFAGGGSIGLEASSRGASRVVFYEQDRRAVAILKSNMEQLQMGAEGVIVSSNLWRKGITLPVGWGKHDLVFLDPPFPVTNDLSPSSRMGVLLQRLRQDHVVDDDVLLVFRHEQSVKVVDSLPGEWFVVDQRTYGRNVLTLLRSDDPNHEPAWKEHLESKVE